MSNPEPPSQQPPASPPGPLPPGFAAPSGPPPVPGPASAPPGYPPIPTQHGAAAAPPQQPGYGNPSPQQPGYGYPPPQQQQQPGYGPPQPGYPPAPGHPPQPNYAPQPGYPPSSGQTPPPGYGQPGYPYQDGQPVPPAKKSRTGLVIGIVAGGVALLLLLVCGVAGFLWYQQRNEASGGDLSKVINYRQTNPGALSPDHVQEPVTYPMTPPAGGPHFQRWQNCNGDVYLAPIEDGNAVHSLEHGAVWITYRPGLPPSELGKLQDRVRGLSHMMISPYPGQSAPISLQAWGYQLTVEEADDPSIRAFISAYRVTAAIEAGAPCGGGITTTR